MVIAIGTLLVAGMLAIGPTAPGAQAEEHILQQFGGRASARISGDRERWFRSRSRLLFARGILRYGSPDRLDGRRSSGGNAMQVNGEGCPIHVEVQGDEDAPVLMLSNSLGTTHRMWDDQVKPFTEAFRLVRYDRRGHGQSGCPQGPYTMDRLGRDALAILDALGIEKTNWCGLSMGGMVGMWLGAHAPERIDKLILSNTSAYFADKALWNDRIRTVREKGLEGIVGANMERWFTKDFRERAPRAIARMSEMFVATPLEGYIGCCEAVRDMDHRDIIRDIKARTLVIAGRYDPATTVEAAEFIRSRIPGAALTLLEAAHIANVEQPHDYADTVLGFLLQK
jgi:3-oxoadipate enol-lactonase